MLHFNISIVFKNWCFLLELQHEFNFPYQIGSYGDGLDKSIELEIEIQEGDIILLGTDGLFDNLSLEDIVTKLFEPNDYISTASFIATTAHEYSLRTEGMSPHGNRAMEAGFYHVGGKPDDITLIIGTVNLK